VFVKFLKCAENVPKPSNYPAPFPESCRKVVMQNNQNNHTLRNIWFSEHYVLAGIVLYCKDTHSEVMNEATDIGS
jgi:hypothetical protein